MRDERLIYFNGINGDSGEYGLPPMTSEELARFVSGASDSGDPSGSAVQNELRFRREQMRQSSYDVARDVDPGNLKDTGWGIIFAHDADPGIEEALSQLIELRREQAGDRFRAYRGGDGYRRDKDTKNSFLARHGMGPGPANPDRVPYYLLIVGSPEAVPFNFQQQLDVQYAVGRIHFDTLQEYANYAASVVATERGQVKLPRRAAFFGVANVDDPATEASASMLIEPLHHQLKANRWDWETTAALRFDATKARLARLLGGDETPALLVAASHGMEFPLGSRLQIPYQGALLCDDWPGPRQWWQPIPHDFYYAGDDLSNEARLLGLTAILFASYSAGTARSDPFARQAIPNKAVAPFAFLGSLPRRMLGHPRGGALAVIGYAERAWNSLYRLSDVEAQRVVVEGLMQRLFEGLPVGFALEFVNQRYAELATELSSELEEIQFGKTADPSRMASLWTASNDARTFTIIGDPAVRLPVVKEAETPTPRSSILPGESMGKDIPMPLLA